MAGDLSRFTRVLVTSNLDQVALKVLGFSTQTTNIIEVKNFADSSLLSIDGTGNVFVATGTVFIGDTANTKMTLGLTINQGANDDEILALKSSDVAHGITDYAETDTFGWFAKVSAADGGLLMQGATEGEVSFRLQGFYTTDDVGKATTANAALEFDAWKKSGTAVDAPGANANIVAIKSAASTRFIFDAEGEMHSDDIIGVGDDWDEWDDLALASDLSRLPKAKFDEMMKYKADDFERAGLLTLSTDEHGNRHAFLRHKAMLQFAMCCFAEVAKKLRVYENALLSLGISPKLLQEA